MPPDASLWWVMVLTGCAAAALGLVATALGQRRDAEATSTRRYQLTIASYVLLSVSILTFAARGLLLPQ